MSEQASESVVTVRTTGAQIVFHSQRRIAMKHLILGFVLLFLAPVAMAQAQTDWLTLVTGSRSSGYAVEGATKIDVSTAKTLHDRGVKFVDVGRKRRWKKRHIPDATRFFVPSEAALMEIVDKDKEVVFYSWGDYGKVADASARAVVWGYENVYYFSEGLRGWEAAGHPIEKAE